MPSTKLAEELKKAEAAYRRMMKRLDEGTSLGRLKVKWEDVYDC